MPIVNCKRCGEKPVESVFQGYYKIVCPNCKMPQRVPIGKSRNSAEKIENLAIAKAKTAKQWNLFN